MKLLLKAEGDFESAGDGRAIGCRGYGPDGEWLDETPQHYREQQQKSGRGKKD
jgi:hypothetical protein